MTFLFLIIFPFMSLHCKLVPVQYREYDIYLFLIIFRHMSLHCKLVPVQYREYDINLLLMIFSCMSLHCKLQWATKVVETLLGNDAFRYLSICSILFASSVNSLIPRPPNPMLCRRCGLCSRTNRKLNIVLGAREKMWPRCSKIQFYYQVSQHFCRPL